MKIRLVQMNCHKGAIDENLEVTRKFIHQASDDRIDVICFPEANITGYVNPEKFPDAVISTDDRRIQDFIKSTAGTSILALASLIEQNDSGKPYITQLVIRDGGLVGSYQKNRIADDETEKFTTGSDRPIFEHQRIKFGISICADIENESLFKKYASEGVALVFEAAAPGLYGSQENRDWQKGFLWWQNECKEKFGRYAKENNLYIVVATQAGRTVDEDFPGGGYVFDNLGNLVAASTDWSPDILDCEIKNI